MRGQPASATHREEVSVNTVHRGFAVLAVVATAACAPGIHIRTDFDRNVDFSKYRTIAVKQGNSSGDPVMDRRIIEDIEQALQAKGYEIVPEPMADAIAVEHAATREKHAYRTFYETWPGWGWRWGWAVPVVEEYDFTVGTLVVDMFDARTRQAVWHGSARGVISDRLEKNIEEVKLAVDKLFQRFPPTRRG
jgi:hypothetical protein